MLKSCLLIKTNALYSRSKLKPHEKYLKTVLSVLKLSYFEFQGRFLCKGN
ncbi:MAG: hypothetical protein JWR60_549 [Polaromonas sp.]|nr:hypothetical protein [Polaromonas sp.]